MSETIFYGSNSNRALVGAHVSWDTCHDLANGTILTNYGSPFYLLWAGSYLSGGLHRIYRPVLFFDTSSLPDSAVISGAILALYSFDHECDKISRPNLYIVEGVQGDPVVVANYGDELPYVTSWGSIDLGNIVDDQYNNINLTADGLAGINKTGITKFCLKGQFDLDDIDPASVYDNWLKFHSNQKGTVYRPKLTVTYSIALARSQAHLI